MTTAAAHLGPATIVNVTTLAQAVIYSLVAGVGLAVAYGVAVTGTAGLLDAVRSHRTAVAIAWGACVVVCAAVVVGGIAAGIIVMANG